MVKKIFKAIGLMSGTSCDGVDLSYLESDGMGFVKYLGNHFIKYSEEFKKKLRFLLVGNPTILEIKMIENELTQIHANCVNEFIANNNIDRSEIDLIGFHGQTVIHKPQQQVTWQIGNVDMLQHLTKIDVIANFRMPDIMSGGQGAPLAPIYHFYLFKEHNIPTLILNIGGVANITFFANNEENSLQAFDFCFGNAISDDLIKEIRGFDYDEDGNVALQGTVDFTVASKILQEQIFYKDPPKSFDRYDFDKIINPIKTLKLEDALATLAYIFAKVLKINIEKFIKIKPERIIICGGGRKNKAIINEITQQLEGTDVMLAEDSKLNGDFIESEAFAFLAIRKKLGMPISFNKTTGIIAS